MNDLLLVWWGLMLIGFIGSALYSGIETGCYSLNRVRLQILDHQHHRQAQVLRRLLAHPTALLSTLLIGNNIMNYLGTASLTVILEEQGLSDLQVVLLNVALVTPLLFIFGETLPKDLFAAHADRMVYPLTPVLTLSRRVFTWLGFVPLVNGFTAALLKLMGGSPQNLGFHPRRHVESLVKEGLGYGLISDEQSSIVGRVLALSKLTLGDEMVPWRQVLWVKADDSSAVLFDLAEKTPRTRYPVLDAAGRVAGVVNVTDALRHGREACPPLAELMQPPLMLESTTPLRDALRQLQRSHGALAIVTERDRPVGVATVKDVIEPVVGDLSHW